MFISRWNLFCQLTSKQKALRKKCFLFWKRSATKRAKTDGIVTFEKLILNTIYVIISRIDKAEFT